MVKKLIVILGVFFPVFCFAAGTSTKNVGQIELREDLLLISTSDGSGWNATESCIAGNGTNSVAVLKTHDNFAEIYSTVLSARVAGLPISFWVSGCHPWNSHSYAKVTTIYVRNQ